MTIDDIANYCEFMDCTVSLGDPQTGFLQVDGTGLIRRVNNYRRFLQFNELSNLASPRDVLARATVVRIQSPAGERLLSREEFEQELQEFQRRVLA